MKTQFCVKYFELQHIMHVQALNAEFDGIERVKYEPYNQAVSEMKAHLDGCGDCKAHLMELAYESTAR
jgi:hypothetical protein